jgi:4-carboxymuconolactone decarboxylase
MQSERTAPVPIPLNEELQNIMNKIFPSYLPSPNLYRIVAKNEALLKELVETRFIGPTGLFDKKRIAALLREKIILRTCVATNNHYEFALHEETISLKMGVSISQINDIKNQVLNIEYWESKDIILFKLIDKLVKHISVSDEDFKTVSSYFEEAELIDIIHIIGLYTGVAMLVAFFKPSLDNYKQYKK